MSKEQAELNIAIANSEKPMLPTMDDIHPQGMEILKYRIREPNQPVGVVNDGQTCALSALLVILYSIPDFVKPILTFPHLSISSVVAQCQ